MQKFLYGFISAISMVTMKKIVRIDVQGVSYRTRQCNLSLRCRNMQVKISLKIVRKS